MLEQSNIEIIQDADYYRVASDTIHIKHLTDKLNSNFEVDQSIRIRTSCGQSVYSLSMLAKIDNLIYWPYCEYYDAAMLKVVSELFPEYESLRKESAKTSQASPTVKLVNTSYFCIFKIKTGKITRLLSLKNDDVSKFKCNPS